MHGFYIDKKEKNISFDIIIDFNTDNYTLYHCGASSKDSGNKINTITRIDDKDNYDLIINEIQNNDNLDL